MNNNIDNLKLQISNESYDYERVMKAFKGEQELIKKIQVIHNKIQKIQVIHNKIQVNQQND